MPTASASTSVCGKFSHADGENGLLVPPGDPSALADAIRRFLGDGDLRARLTAAAAPSAERFSSERIYGRLEEILAGAAA